MNLIISLLDARIWFKKLQKVSKKFIRSSASSS